MSNGNGEQLTQMLGMGTNGMQQSAQQGMSQTAQAGGSPLVTPEASVYGVGTSTAPMPGAIPVTGTAGAGQTNSVQPPQGNNPYSAFLTALQQIQNASPAQEVAGVTPNVHRSQAANTATMRETGVG